MTVYSVFTHHNDPEPKLVADRFSWFAAILPPVYMLLHGLWLGLAGLIVIAVALGFAATLIGPDAAILLYLLLAVFIGFEAHTLRRMTLRRKGFRYRSERVAESEEGAAVAWLSTHR